MKLKTNNKRKYMNIQNSFTEETKNFLATDQCFEWSNRQKGLTFENPCVIQDSTSERTVRKGKVRTMKDGRV
jgi:hypothetical protein